MLWSDELICDIHSTLEWALSDTEAVKLCAYVIEVHGAQSC